MGKNAKSLERRNYKGFCVFLLYRMVVVLLKQEENRVKKAKSAIFSKLKALQNKDFSEILS